MKWMGLGGKLPIWLLDMLMTCCSVTFHLSTVRTVGRETVYKGELDMNIV